MAVDLGNCPPYIFANYSLLQGQFLIFEMACPLLPNDSLLYNCTLSFLLSTFILLYSLTFTLLLIFKNLVEFGLTYVCELVVLL